MEFKDIEEAVLAASNIASRLKDPELTTAIQSILDKCVSFREAHNFKTPGVEDTNAKESEDNSREKVPEQMQDLWDIMHNDEVINSMKRGM